MTILTKYFWKMVPAPESAQGTTPPRAPCHSHRGSRCHPRAHPAGPAPSSRYATRAPPARWKPWRGEAERRLPRPLFPATGTTRGSAICGTVGQTTRTRLVASESTRSRRTLSSTRLWLLPKKQMDEVLGTMNGAFRSRKQVSKDDIANVLANW